MFPKLKDVLFSSKVDLYQEEVRHRNYISFISFLVVGTFISLMVLLFGLIMQKIVTFNTEFFMMFCYCAGLLLVSKLFLKKHMRYITLIFYLVLTPLMVLAILMGTFLDPEQPSITIMVFICVLPIFLLDKPWRVVLYITCTAVIYTICCYIAKDFEMFMADMIDLITFYILAVGVNCFSLHDRIDSVENFVKFRNKSETDNLTGLYNRGAGVEKIENLLRKSKFGAFMIMDVDDFKHINDRYGHIVGDNVLRVVSETLRKSFGMNDIILRMGGDEFAVYVTGMTDDKQCEKLFEHFFGELKKAKVPLEESSLSVSLGCSIYRAGTGDFEQLYKSGDECLYEAKKSGKGRYNIHIDKK